MTTAPPSEARRRPTGRRAGDSGTREAILDAALRLFAERGYDGASLRAIAAEAGVDPALIRHFYGDKNTLFATAVTDRTTFPERVVGSLGGDPADIGRRVADAYLRMWEEPGSRPILLALVRSTTTSARAAELLRDTLSARIQSSAGLHDVDDDARMRRVALAGSHLLGLALARHVVALPALADLDHDTLVDQVAPTIQRYLTGTHL